MYIETVINKIEGNIVDKNISDYFGITNIEILTFLPT